MLNRVKNKYGLNHIIYDFRELDVTDTHVMDANMELPHNDGASSESSVDTRAASDR